MSILPNDASPAGARSLLFVPGDRPERFRKAALSGADAVVIDLEDAVAPESKAQARQNILDFLDQGGHAVLRINAADARGLTDDLPLCGHPGVTGVIYPKAETSTELCFVREKMRDGVPLMPLIETALGMSNLHLIASTSGVTRLLFGSLDFCLDTGIDPGPDEAELMGYRSMLVLASRACGLLPPVDGVTVKIDDTEELSRAALAARRLGFGGKLCIHPSQIELVHAAFDASIEDLKWAERVVFAATGQRGAFMLDGRMVDAPVLDRARRLLNGPRR